VDFQRRRAALCAADNPANLAQHWRDGRIKQALIARVLAVRRALPALFARGDYRALKSTGPHAEHLVAFTRSSSDNTSIAIVPRFPTILLGDTDSIVFPARSWQDTALLMPDHLRGRSIRNAITGATIGPLGESLPIPRALADLPVALFTTE